MCSRSTIAAILAIVVMVVARPSKAVAAEPVPNGRAGSDAAPHALGSDQSSGLAPLSTFIDEEGRRCRLYERRVVIDGESIAAVAQVCRDANGRWVLSR